VNCTSRSVSGLVLAGLLKHRMVRIHAVPALQLSQPDYGDEMDKDCTP